ncbi:hypothetical protein GLA29479_2338 [Lysobacter antibioticus]|nr:hypothetical protein GLA29479_2338 [Lysobacter antibioticus]
MARKHVRSPPPSGMTSKGKGPKRQAPRPSLNTKRKAPWTAPTAADSPVRAPSRDVGRGYR